MLTLGVDPGLSGAVAALDIPNRRFVATETPVFTIDGKRSINFRALVDWMRGFDHAEFAVVEKVHAMPKQGVSSTFSFGTAFGAYCAAVASIDVPWKLVTPNQWKRDLDVSADKDSARSRATFLLPWASAAWSRVKDHNVAEAALIAYYAAQIAPPNVKKEAG